MLPGKPVLHHAKRQSQLRMLRSYLRHENRPVRTCTCMYNYICTSMAFNTVSKHTWVRGDHNDHNIVWYIFIGLLNITIRNRAKSSHITQYVHTHTHEFTYTTMCILAYTRQPLSISEICPTELRSIG